MSFPLRTGLSLVQRRFKLRAEDGAIPTEEEGCPGGRPPRRFFEWLINVGAHAKLHGHIQS